MIVIGHINKFLGLTRIWHNSPSSPNLCKYFFHLFKIYYWNVIQQRNAMINEHWIRKSDSLFWTHNPVSIQVTTQRSQESFPTSTGPNCFLFFFQVPILSCILIGESWMCVIQLYWHPGQVLRYITFPWEGDLERQYCSLCEGSNNRD